MMESENKNLKHFAVEFSSMMCRTYNIKAECLQTAKRLAWEEVEKDFGDGNSWKLSRKERADYARHWRNNAQLTCIEEKAEDEDLDFDIPF